MPITGRNTGISRQAASRVRAAQLEAECLELRRERPDPPRDRHRTRCRTLDRLQARRPRLGAVIEHNREEAASLRDLEVMRLDELQAALWHQAVDECDTRAINRILRIMERRAPSSSASMRPCSVRPK